MWIESVLNTTSMKEPLLIFKASLPHIHIIKIQGGYLVFIVVCVILFFLCCNIFILLQPVPHMWP